MKRITFLNIILICFTFFFADAYSQSEEFIGLIELENKTYINFKMNFDITGTKIEGYTITDYNGPHESKSSILGSYDKKTDKITFRELSILYTKSPITELDFCYIYFTGEIKKDRLNGTFKGFYDDLTKCLNGSIYGSRIANAEKEKEKLLKKVSKVIKHNDKKDDALNQIESMKFSEQRGITANENINVFWEGTYLKAQIWDAGTVDGDIIEIRENGEKVSTISPKKKPIDKEFYLSGDRTVITIKALSEGTEPPNTTKVKFTNGKGKQVELIYNLKLNEAATLTFYTKKLSDIKR